MDLIDEFAASLLIVRQVAKSRFLSIEQTRGPC